MAAACSQVKMEKMKKHKAPPRLKELVKYLLACCDKKVAVGAVRELTGWGLDESTMYVLDPMPDSEPDDAQDGTTNLEIIARNRWHEPIAKWPVHDENHKMTITGSKMFDPGCLRCWLERVAAEEYGKAAAAIHGS
jgi:hypothetical protein